MNLKGLKIALPISLILWALIFACINAFAADYYVKNAGSDSATGLSDAQAWVTVAKLNAQTFTGGDNIYFNRGDTWRERLIPDAYRSAGYVTYSAYGNGNKPLLLGSRDKNETTDWTDEGSNIWSCTDVEFSTDVGNVLFNVSSTIEMAVREPDDEGELDAQGEYWWDGTDTIKMYSTSNPASYYTDIECCISENIVGGTIPATLDEVNYVIIENLDFRYGGSHGIGLVQATNMIVRDCDFRWMGGYIFNAANSRWGNGIEFYSDATNILVERCYFYKIWSMAMNNESEYGNTINNCRWRNNKIVDAGLAGFGCAFNADSGGTEAVITDLYVENNTFIDIGNHPCNLLSSQPYKYYQGCLVLVNIDATITDFHLRNNILYVSGNHQGADLPDTVHQDDVDDDADIDINYNCHYSANAARMIDYDGTRYSVAQFTNWQSDSGQGANAVYGDPVFDGGNYALDVTSPCIDEGVTLTDVTSDYRGISRPQGDGYDIGAMEYGFAIGIEGVTLTGVTIQ